MGLLLRPDAYYAETADGMYVLTNEGPVSFTGRTAFHLLTRLAPFLDGRYSLDDLTADLSPQRRESVEKLVAGLVEQGIVRVLESNEPDTVADPDVHEFRHQIEFLGYFRESGVQAFREYRSQATLVLGSDVFCRAIARAASRSGLRQVRVVATETDDDGEQAMSSLLDGIDLVLHACDESGIERAFLLDRLCAEREITLAQALVRGDHAWLGRTEPTRPEAASWTSGWLRLMARERGGASAARESLCSATTPTALCATAVANQLVHEGCVSVAKAAGAETNRMTRIDLVGMDSERHAFMRHPFADPVDHQTGTRYLDKVSRLRDGGRLDDEEFSRRAAACRGQRLGVFGTPTERDFAQIPLHVCEIEVSDPVGLLGRDAPTPTVTGAGLDFATARYQAARRAFGVYASLMLDPRRLASAATAAEDPDEALRALQTGEMVGFADGHRLTDGEPQQVNATDVFPALTTSGHPYRPLPGTGVGYDWQEAVTAGLVERCRHRTLAEVATATEPYPPIDLGQTTLDERGARYRDLLRAVDEPLAVFDVTGTLRVPTVLCFLGATVAGCGSSLSPATALADGLEQALLHYQAKENDQPDYAPPPVPALPEHLRGHTARRYPASQTLNAADLVTRLHERGCCPIAVPLDHDPEVSNVMPYIVHVVFAHA